MRGLAIILLLSSLAGSSHAIAPDIFGYFEPQLMWTDVIGESATLNSNKLRLDIEAKPAKGVKFGANVNFLVYSGMTHYNLYDFIPDNLSHLLPASMEYLYEIEYSDEIVLDNAYLKLSHDFADLTIGRQQISYGTGYAWNPTDVFSQKDLLDPTYEQPGHDAVRLDIPFTNRVRGMLLYAPGEYFNESTGLFRLKVGVAHFEIAGTYSILPWERIEPFTYVGTGEELPQFFYEEGWRDLYGFDIVGQLFGLGVWVEFAYNEVRPVVTFGETEYYRESVIGFDYTFRNELYILGEYYRNSQGRTEMASEPYNWYYMPEEWMLWLMGESRALGRDQAYLYVQYPITDLITAGCSFIGCISDESMALVPQLNYSLFQDVELTAFGNFYLGDEGTMYSKDLGNGGLVRLRVYF